MESELGLLSRAQLRKEATRERVKAHKLRTLHDIGTAIVSALEVDKVLTRVVEAAVFITNAEEASLLLLDEQTDQLYLRAQKGLGDKYAQGFRIPTEDSIAGEVIRTAKPQRLAGKGKRLKVVTGYTVNSIVYVPLIVRGTVIGVLSVDNQTAERSFTEDDESFLSILAGYAALTLENARLLEELDRRAQVLADAYGIERLEPTWQVDLETVGIVLYQRPELAPPEASIPQQLTTLMSPYLNAVTELQHIMDELEDRPLSKVRVLAITQDRPTVASVEGIRRAVEVIEQMITPWSDEFEQDMAQLLVKEREAAVHRAEAEALEAQAWVADHMAEKGKLLAEAAKQYAEVERVQQESKSLHRQIQHAKIRLALDLVAQFNSRLTNEETIAYAMRLLPALESIISAPFQVSTVPQRRGVTILPESVVK